MVDKIDMSLEDIIKTNKIGFRRGGTAKKPQANGAGGQRRPRQQQQQQNTKFRGTANRQIGKPKGRTFGASQPRKFTRVRKS